MERSHLSDFLKDSDNVKLFQQELLLVEVSSLISSTMKEKGISRTQLAKLLGVTKGRISHYLGGEKNLRLRTLADIFTALNCKLKVQVGESSQSGEWLMVQQEKTSTYKIRETWIPQEALYPAADLYTLAG